MKTDVETIEADNKICKGCLCTRLAMESNQPINMMCHGNPLLIDKHSVEIARCPCEDCIIKPMCRETCIKYRFYERLAKGKMSIDTYQESY